MQSSTPKMDADSNMKKKKDNPLQYNKPGLPITQNRNSPEIWSWKTTNFFQSLKNLSKKNRFQICAVESSSFLSWSRKIIDCVSVCFLILSRCMRKTTFGINSESFPILISNNAINRCGNLLVWKVVLVRRLSGGDQWMHIMW